ncbi:MAG: hypothetical protein EBV03_04685 [Proteobacteria bacterium]|nr:hypothetical protein [Pseudomonadota bacterium]
MFIRLLGAWVGVAAIAESYCRQALACNEGQVERRLGEILQASGETPTTEQQALRRLIQLAKTEYSDGELIALDGWVLPESVVLANAYVHLKNL